MIRYFFFSRLSFGSGTTVWCCRLITRRFVSIKRFSTPAFLCRRRLNRGRTTSNHRHRQWMAALTRARTEFWSQTRTSSPIWLNPLQKRSFDKRLPLSEAVPMKEQICLFWLVFEDGDLSRQNKQTINRRLFFSSEHLPCWNIVFFSYRFLVILCRQVLHFLKGAERKKIEENIVKGTNKRWRIWITTQWANSQYGFALDITTQIVWKWFCLLFGHTGYRHSLTWFRFQWLTMTTRYDKKIN